MGLQSLQAGQYDHALLSFAHVLKLDPRHQDAAYKSGVLLHHMGRFDESIAHLDLCDALLPNHAPTLQARARTLFSLKRFEAALAENRRAHTLDPGNADTCNNIGACLQSLGREEEALSWFDMALDRLPNTTEILNNKALMLSQLQRFDEAFALYDQIRARQLNDATTDWNLALLQMLTGNFEAGWAGREARWQNPIRRRLPEIQPADVARRGTHRRQDHPRPCRRRGWAIPFSSCAMCRCSPRAARASFWWSRRRLHSLLSACRASHNVFRSRTSPLPRVRHALPDRRACRWPSARASIPFPSATSYLPAPAEARVQFWEARLRRLHDKLRVGLVWSGNPSHRNDRQPLDIPRG